VLFASEQLLNGQDYEDTEYMIRKLIDEYEIWGLKLNLKKTPRYLELEYRKIIVAYSN
jgi:hypothetical protein